MAPTKTIEKPVNTVLLDRLKRDVAEYKKREGQLKLLLDKSEKVCADRLLSLEEANWALNESELARKITQEELQKKDEENQCLQKLLNEKNKGATVVDKELTETQRTAVGVIARRTLWVKYKMVNDLSFNSGDILDQCHSDMSLATGAEQTCLEKAIKMEYCRSLSQHKYVVKCAIMSAWAGEYYVRFDLLCALRSNLTLYSCVTSDRLLLQ